MLARMASTDDEQLKVALAALQQAGADWLTFAALRAAGIRRPAACIYELELAGHPIERGPDGVRLATGERKPPPEPRPRVMSRPRD
jgi:hypothetical protein